MNYNAPPLTEDLADSFGPEVIKAAYEKRRRKVDEDSEHTSAGLSVPDDRANEILSFNDIAFPNALIMNDQDIEASFEELLHKSPVSQETLRLENSRLGSSGKLAEGRYSFQNRVRRSRDLGSRRNSFSMGMPANSKNDNSYFSESTEPSPSHYGFMHSMSSPRMEGNERWPDRICRLLTNDQSVPARLKMFQYFSSVLCALQQRNDSSLPAALLPRKTGLRLESGAWSICKQGKVNGGEDAYFAGVDSFAGVADGVGEWGDYGCSPRQFAIALMDGSCENAVKQPFHSLNSAISEERASLRALTVLKSGFEKAKSMEGCFGSSTCLVAGLDCKGEKLGIACLGDSSCIVLRRSPPLLKPMSITKRTREQQHFFNCPYQLSRLPEAHELPTLEQRGLYKLIRVLANMNPDMGGDTPDQADLVDITIKEGDLVILGTDGLFDNLFDHEIISLASLALSPYEADLFFTSANAGGGDDVGYGPLDHARKLTIDWVHNKRAHPMALDPPTLYNSGATQTIATPASLVAKAIAEAAFYRSIDSRAKSPFAKAARAAGGSAVGGKEDDITVVACWVIAEKGGSS